MTIFLLQIGTTVITKLGQLSYYKSVQVFSQIGAAITN